MPCTIAQLNGLNQADFTRLIGPVFEHSPWIAAATWSKRPFASVAALHGALCRTVREAGGGKQLALIRAHPDLAGRDAWARIGQRTGRRGFEPAERGGDGSVPTIQRRVSREVRVPVRDLRAVEPEGRDPPGIRAAAEKRARRGNPDGPGGNFQDCRIASPGFNSRLIMPGKLTTHVLDTTRGGP